MYYYQNLCCPIVAQGTILWTPVYQLHTQPNQSKLFLFLLLWSQIRYNFIK
jgi:hypothetical protein